MYILLNFFILVVLSSYASAMEQNLQEPLCSAAIGTDPVMSPLKNKFARAKLSSPVKAKSPLKDKSLYKTGKKFEELFGSKNYLNHSKQSLLSKAQTHEEWKKRLGSRTKFEEKKSTEVSGDEFIVSAPITSPRRVTALDSLLLPVNIERKKHELELAATFPYPQVQCMDRKMLLGTKIGVAPQVMQR